MAIDRNDSPIVFVEDGRVVVNFGILAGREATQAESDRLALVLRKAGAGAEMTITAERRQDYAPGFEGVVHQVRVTFAPKIGASSRSTCSEPSLFRRGPTRQRNDQADEEKRCQEVETEGPDLS